MRIKSVHVRDFKRFTDLTISDIPTTARLVVLVGPNGSGKSSLFEAFNYWMSPFRGVNYQKDYHSKIGSTSDDNWDVVHRKINVDFHGDTVDPRVAGDKAKRAFYFRTAYRHEADFNLQSISHTGELLDDIGRPQMLISAEARVAGNYQRIVSATIDELYDEKNDALLVSTLRERLIGRVRASMTRVFGDLILKGPGKPMIDGTFLFEKGTANDFRYKNLSGGEKAAFDLLLDFVIKTEAFNDTVFCIDEPELHMHTKLQGTLLDEMYALIPPGCQLWLATHSIGMTRRAMEIHQSNPGEVSFLDFEGRDFDISAHVVPAQVDRHFWKRVFTVALGDLAELVAPSQIVFCEGRAERRGAQRNTTFDAEVYRRIFRTSHPNTEFVGLGGTSEVEKNALVIGAVLGQLFSSIQTWVLFDRDDRSDDEILALKANNTRVLRRRDLESYLWDDAIISRLCMSVGQPDAAAELTARKQQLLIEAATKGYPADDVKAIAGTLYVETKRRLGLTQCGNTAEEFCKVMLAPLCVSGTEVYSELELAVFGGKTQYPGRSEAAGTAYDRSA